MTGFDLLEKLRGMNADELNLPIFKMTWSATEWADAVYDEADEINAVTLQTNQMMVAANSGITKKALILS